MPHKSMLSALLFGACLFAACAPQILPPSGPHPPFPADAITIYQDRPMKYELLGTIALPVTPEMTFDARGDSTAGFEALKAKASAMGANGVLLKVDHGEANIEVGVGYKGKYYLVPLKSEPKTAYAQAIFVLP